MAVCGGVTECKNFENNVEIKTIAKFAVEEHNKKENNKMAVLGGITECKNFANNVEIENIAKFAVEEHNKKDNATLEFVKVVNAKEQVVAGTMYYITIETKDGKMYEAKVWVKPWENFKELQEFKPAA